MSLVKFIFVIFIAAAVAVGITYNPLLAFPVSLILSLGYVWEQIKNDN